MGSAKRNDAPLFMIDELYGEFICGNRIYRKVLQATI